MYKGLKTIVIDIENTLVTQIEIKSKQDLEILKSLDNFACDYIVVYPKRNSNCCEYNGTDQCICKLQVYQVRPYTYDILRAM